MAATVAELESSYRELKKPSQARDREIQTLKQVHEREIERIRAESDE